MSNQKKSRELADEQDKQLEERLKVAEKQIKKYEDENDDAVVLRNGALVPEEVRDPETGVPAESGEEDKVREQREQQSQEDSSKEDRKRPERVTKRASEK